MGRIFKELIFAGTLVRHDNKLISCSAPFYSRYLWYCYRCVSLSKIICGPHVCLEGLRFHLHVCPADRLLKSQLQSFSVMMKICPFTCFKSLKEEDFFLSQNQIATGGVQLLHISFLTCVVSYSLSFSCFTLLFTSLLPDSWTAVGPPAIYRTLCLLIFPT